MADALSKSVRPVLLFGGLVLSLAVLIPSGLIYDGLARQEELYFRARVAALTLRLESLPGGQSRLEWQNALQREEPLLRRLGVYARGPVDEPGEAATGEPQPFRAVVPFQDSGGASFVEFELARGEPETIGERARQSALISALGGVLVFALSVFGAWGASRLRAAGRADVEREQNASLEAMSAGVAKEFEAAAGALKALPKPESAELVPYSKDRLERMANEMGILGGRPNPTIANVDSAALVRWVEQRIQGVKLTVASPGVRFASDANLLGEAVLRLVRNAAEANPQGEVRIEFLRPKENALTIRVSDAGSGVPPAAQARLYDPFFTTKGPDAVGLGLPVARKLVSALGGTVTVAGKADGGTSAEVRLENLSVSAV